MTTALLAVLIVAFALDLYVNLRVDRRLGDLKLQILLLRNRREENTIMAIGQEILDKIAAETTLVKSVQAYVVHLQGDVIDEATKSAIIKNLDDNAAALEGVLPANTPVAPAPTEEPAPPAAPEPGADDPSPTP